MKRESDREGGYFQEARSRGAKQRHSFVIGRVSFRESVAISSFVPLSLRGFPKGSRGNLAFKKGKYDIASVSLASMGIGL